MKNLKTIILLAVVAPLMGMSARAEIIAAWDFADERNGETPAGWTVWPTDSITNIGASLVIGDLTLTHTSGDDDWKRSAYDVVTESAPALLEANNTVWDDYLRVDTSQGFELSGLTAGEEYRFQVVGHVKTSTNGTRNVEIVMDDAAGTTVNLLDPPGTGDSVDNAAFSPYLTFTATTGDTEVVFLFNKLSSGASTGVSGLIVEINPGAADGPLITSIGATGTSITVGFTDPAGYLDAYELHSSATTADGSYAKDEGAAISDLGGDSFVAATAFSAPSQFYAVVKKPVPPLLDADFEDDDGGFTLTTTSGTDWEVGAPTSTGVGGSVTNGNGGSTNCWGTGIGNPGYYIDPTDTSLVSPVIDLTGVPSATLTFAEALDLGVDGNDTAEVNIIEGNTTNVIAQAIYTASDPNIGASDWADVGLTLPAAALGQEIRIEFRFHGEGALTDDYMGWYIDDVMVTIP